MHLMLSSSSSVSEKGPHFTCQLPAVQIVIQIEKSVIQKYIIYTFLFLVNAYLVLTLCGLALRSTRMTRPRVQRTSP